MLQPDRFLTALETEAAYRLAHNRLARYRPYAKQIEFHAAGATHRERAILAANQSGKTLAGAYELAMHLTGNYPGWWTGRRWDRPVIAWAAGVTGESTRDNPQRLLMGRPEDWGTGAIPVGAIYGRPARAMGVADLVDTVRVKHASGGLSTLAFKFYEKGREKWQGETLDIVWYDEEPPPEIYTEGLTRTNATGGLVFLTATPLLGMTDVVSLFYPEPSTPDRHLTQMTIDDAEHYTPEQRATIIASYPDHEREARVQGIPMLGSGRIYPVAESAITCEPFPIPDWWGRICGMDFGWDHPTTAVWLAHDRESDTVYLYDSYRARQQSIPIHASAIKARRPADIPVAWPHDGLQHDKRAGEQLAQSYRNEGVAMLGEMAKFAGDRGTSVEAGIQELLTRMQTGRLRVFSHMNDWLAEFRQYHRDEGRIVKSFDDLLDATRYGIMMLRHASTTGEAPTSTRYARKRGSGSWMTA
jgi:phage terminase large subunit-like protein